MAGKTNRARKSRTESKGASKIASKGASKSAAKTASQSASKTKVDPITLSVIRGILETTQREMTLSLEKTARSSVFNLAHDYSTALFNHAPEMILQGQDIPIHLGSLIPAMKSVARYFSDDIHEGDLILHNDPAFGGSHAIDVCMYKPVFYKGTLRYWTVCKGHLTDIGGPVPAGYNPNATEIYAECLRIPPVKIWDRGKPRTDELMGKRAMMFLGAQPKNWGDLQPKARFFLALTPSDRRFPPPWAAGGVTTLTGRSTATRSSTLG
jgi:N-methylhydantoinase B/oxoprolinase/acetone carboxylase alpha subunit